MPLDAAGNLLILLRSVGSGDQRSIQLSYRRAGRLPQVYEVCGSVQHGKKDARTKLILSLIGFPRQSYSLKGRCVIRAICARTRWGERSQPLARSLICFANFSISSAFLTRATERTAVESVFSTSVFNWVTSW